MYDFAQKSIIKVKVSGIKSYYKQHLPALFQKIELGKPVHFKRFLLGLAECGISPNEVERILDKKFVGKKRYRVSIKPNSFKAYQELRAETCKGQINGRALAAAQGKSHSKSTSGTFCLIHTKQHQTTPFCIMIDSGVPRDVPQLNKNLLLIENFELFLNYQAMIDFVTHKCGMPVNLQEWDVIYSQGSGILNKQFVPLLMGYKKVVCLFDLDFGGVITYTTLKQRLNSDIQFAYPEDVEVWVQRYGFEMPNNECQQLKNLAGGAGIPKRAKKVIELLLKTKRKLEQEVYLI